MIVDDSALMRQLIFEILSQDPDFGLIESAQDPIFALRKMEKSWPDVIVLDIEMPRMNGIEFSRQIMRERPTPIVIVSSKTEKNLALGIEALKNGAVELINKPEFGLKDFIENAAPALIQTLKAAAMSNLAKNQSLAADLDRVAASGANRLKNTDQPSGMNLRDRLIVIGASTGGTTALEKIIAAIDFPHCGIVVVQHMPAGFTKAFADRLDRIYPSHVYEAKDGDFVKDNCIYIAPGGLQTDLVREKNQYKIRVTDAPPVNRHKPSVDVLFDSVAKMGVKNVLAIILTGMGGDGAKGMLEIYKKGGATIAQDAQTSVVFGMPAEAIALGGAKSVRPLDKIWEDIKEYCRP